MRPWCVGGRVVLIGLAAVTALVTTGCSEQGRSAPAPVEQVTPQTPGDNVTEAGGAARRNPDEPPEAERKIIRTANLRLRVDRLDEATRRVRELATGSGGHVQAESVDTDSGTLTLRVPAERLDEVLNRFGEIGGVEHRDIATQDVTERMVDIEARIANQRASVERVRAMMDRAGDLTQLVRIEEELTKRQAELDSLVRRQQTLSGQVTMSTITVTISARSSAPPVVREGFSGGLASGWRALVDTVRVLLVVLGAALPFLLVIGIPIAVLVVWTRRRTAGRAPVVPARFAGPPVGHFPPPGHGAPRPPERTTDPRPDGPGGTGREPSGGDH